MPRVTRKGSISAPAGDVYRVIADPYHLPRWWPRTTRVENVSDGEPKGRRWTTVLETKEGRGVRADYRCISAAQPERYIFEQVITGTPFEKFLKSSQTSFELEQTPEGTAIKVSMEQTLRGLSRFGSPMMRRATKRMLGEALEGLDTAVTGGAG